VKFKATDEQIKQLIINAINTSRPVGMGIFHYKQKFYTLDDLTFEIGNEVFVDYFDGRMVKLYLTKENDLWKTPNKELDIEYQSWCEHFPTWKDLLHSVNIESEGEK